MSSDNRFQHQPWYVRLWRRRHQLAVPFQATRWWLHHRNKGHPDSDFRFHWSLAMGIAHHRMKWTYTSAEVFGSLFPSRSSGPDDEAPGSRPGV